MPFPTRLKSHNEKENIVSYSYSFFFFLVFVLYYTNPRQFVGGSKKEEKREKKDDRNFLGVLFLIILNFWTILFLFRLPFKINGGFEI